MGISGAFTNNTSAPSAATSDQVRFLRARLRELLVDDPMVHEDPARVRLVATGPSSLDLEDSRGILSVTLRKRALIILADLGMIALSYYLSFLLVSDWVLSPEQGARFVTTLPLVLIIRFGVFCYFGLYAGVWRYASLNDLVQIVKAVSVGTVVMVLPVSRGMGDSSKSPRAR